jgi:hypothetical protein
MIGLRLASRCTHIGSMSRSGELLLDRDAPLKCYLARIVAPFTMLFSALDERALACTCKKPECVEAIYHRYGAGAAIRGNEGTVVSSPRRLGWAEPLVYAPPIMDCSWRSRTLKQRRTP